MKIFMKNKKSIVVIVSYLSLLLLRMQVTKTAIILTIVYFALGTSLIVAAKLYNAECWDFKLYSPIPSVAVVVAYYGYGFYSRWSPSSKIRLIASAFGISASVLVWVATIVFSFFAGFFLYGLFQKANRILTPLSEKGAFAKSIVSCVLVAVVTVALAQAMIEVDILSMGLTKFLWGVLIVATMILFLYSLIGNRKLSMILGGGLFMVISTVNVYVYRFRDRLFEPVDIFSAGTAMNVAENYQFTPVPQNLLVGWAVFVAVLIFLFGVPCKEKESFSRKRRIMLLICCIISSAAIFFYTSNLKTYNWRNDGALFNGYVLNFVSQSKEAYVTEPDGYTDEIVAELSGQYGNTGEKGSSSVSKDYPHIIVIMDESFSDLRVIGDFLTNEEVTPFISSLKEQDNTISGYALASVYGGNTANSEFEFLTGNSMAWMSSNAVPYRQYIRSSTYSMVSYLKSVSSYKCIAMHPYQANGWNRPSAYGYLGFDECFFIEDFPQQDFIRYYISDQEMFEFLIKTFEEEKDDPLFIFGVSMQNHGGYTYSGEDYAPTISLTEYENDYPEVEQYLSLLNETDKAVADLISYFSKVEDDVVIVFFGDHQPKIEESFYETVCANTDDSLDEQQEKYKVPFFIWANYDIEEDYIECTSLNYLSSYVYKAAGISMPPYNQFLSEMEEAIPAINASGFYSLSSECYLPFDEGSEEEQAWLGLYEILQYNNVFGGAQRNEIMFPILE